MIQQQGEIGFYDADLHEEDADMIKHQVESNEGTGGIVDAAASGDWPSAFGRLRALGQPECGGQSPGVIERCSKSRAGGPAEVRRPGRGILRFPARMLARVWRGLERAFPRYANRLFRSQRDGRTRGKIDMASFWCVDERFALRDSSGGQIVPGVSSIRDASRTNSALARLAHS